MFKWTHFVCLFVSSEPETVTLFCGFIKSTLQCVNTSLCFQRLEKKVSKCKRVCGLKTDAWRMAGVNRILWLAPHF
jgi:hypothetical protein